jgi:glucose/arabinose dehydrogenase
MNGRRRRPQAWLILTLLPGWTAFLSGGANLRAGETDELPPLLENPREAEYYKLTDLPLPPTATIEAGSFAQLPDGRLVVGTRRGDIYFVPGAFDPKPELRYHLFASGLHEVFGLDWRDGWLYATQQGEVTRLRDLDGDGRADRFETVSDVWGYGGEHEFTFGSKFDRNGFLWTVHCLTGSYTSENKFRGWAFRIAPDGTATPVCSGLRSPGGVGMNAAGDMFYTENQGPWNGACSLKHLRPGGFMGHPIGNKWYALAPNMGPRPVDPVGDESDRLEFEVARIPQFVPPAVYFPYKKMGQSASGIALDDTGGRFGPFTNQLFVGDYTLSIVMRASLEKVNGVYQGACFPFRQGFATGIIGVHLSQDGYLFSSLERIWWWPGMLQT